MGTGGRRVSLRRLATLVLISVIAMDSSARGEAIGQRLQMELGEAQVGVARMQPLSALRRV